LHLEATTLDLCVFLHFSFATLAFGWLYFSDLRAILTARYQNCELGDVAKGFSTRLGVFKFTADVCVSITVELCLSASFLAEDLDVDLGQGKTGLFVSHLEFTVAFQNHDLECVAIEGLELLLVGSVNLDDEIHVLQLVWKWDLLGDVGLLLLFAGTLWKD
jgi:hypothetical protein